MVPAWIRLLEIPRRVVLCTYGTPHSEWSLIKYGSQRLNTVFPVLCRTSVFCGKFEIDEYSEVFRSSVETHVQKRNAVQILFYKNIFRITTAGVILLFLKLGLKLLRGSLLTLVHDL
jgi:hypothetical protein